MVFCFIAFGIALLVSSWLFSMREHLGGCIAGFVAICFFFLGIVAADNKVREGKVEALNQVGIEYLSKEEVYNKSQAELDKMLSITTLGKVYYYDIGEKE